MQIYPPTSQRVVPTSWACSKQRRPNLRSAAGSWLAVTASIHLAPIVADREVLGALVLIDGDDHDDGQLLLERAAPVMALAITRERAVTEATRLTRDAMVIDLLTRPATDPAALRQRMRNAGLDPAAAYCIIAAQPIDELPRRRSSDIAAGLPAGTVVVADGTRLVAVVPAKHPDAAIRGTGVATAVQSATAGVAGPIASPVDLHRCYRGSHRHSWTRC